VFSGSVTIDQINSLLTSNEVFDLSDYVTSINEISTTETTGYTVTLKPDEKDEMFLDTVNTDEKNYIATSRLVIGSGEKEIEIDATTLKVKTIGDYQVSPKLCL
jgi:hypothetical protein